MSNPNKRRGDTYERTVISALHVLGWPYAERTRAGYERDRGDVAGMPGLVVQCKNVKTPRWVEWLTDLADQVRNARADHGVLFFKRPGNTDPRYDLAVMYVEDWARLTRKAGYGSPLDDLADAFRCTCGNANLNGYHYNDRDCYIQTTVDL